MRDSAVTQTGNNEREPDAPGQVDHAFAIRHSWSNSDRVVPRRLLRPLRRIFAHEVAGAVLTFAAVVLATICANTDLIGWYESVWNTPVELTVGSFDSLSHFDLRHWVNDGLMTIFFVLVALEIKRELVSGQLSDRGAALAPVVAALGGMAVPALIYLAINHGTAAELGWGIPVATDIVFAVALLTLFGRHIPQSLRIFLLTLAVADDLGGIVIIAIAYGRHLSGGWLMLAVACVAVALVARHIHVRATGVYVLLGAACWLGLLEGGIHPTIAGVVFGLIVPARSFYDPRTFEARARSLITAISDGFRHRAETAQSALLDMRNLVHETAAPLDRLERWLTPWVMLLIVPLFAFANAGTRIDLAMLQAWDERPVMTGIASSLLVGKPLGILGAMLLLRVCGLPALPKGATWGQAAAVASAGGVGFTVALFISELAFPQTAYAGEAKMGIILGSMAAALSSIALLRLTARRSRQDRTPPGSATSVRVDDRVDLLSSRKM